MHSSIGYVLVRDEDGIEELVEQVTEALHSIGDIALAKKFEEGSKKIKRDIVFAASLYI